MINDGERAEEAIYNVMEEKAYEEQDEIEVFSYFLAHYFLEPRNVIVPLGTVVKELQALLKQLGYRKLYLRNLANYPMIRRDYE